MPIPTAQQPRSASFEIPDKLYFRIGEVARICQVQAYVLRFWESEFQQLAPKKSGTGQRLYRRRDAEMALRIKRLLYDEGYTIPGARQFLQAEARESRNRPGGPELPLTAAASGAAEAGLQKVRKELRELAGLLASPVASGPRNRPSRGRSLPAGQSDTTLFE